MQLQIFVILVMVAKGSLKWQPLEWTNMAIPMVWVDGRHRHPDDIQVDTFYDRIVSISFKIPPQSTPSPHQPMDKIYKYQATGVFITDTLVLTSYNAFRKFAHENNTLYGLRVNFLEKRYIFPDGLTNLYVLRRDLGVECARQVIPHFDPKTEDPSHMRHGFHSPVHDLMVMRLDYKAIFLSPVPESQTEFSNPYITQGTYIQNHDSYSVTVGPILTILAGPQDRLTENLKFASLGHINSEHIRENRFLEPGRVHSEDHLKTDCEEWIPREWGRFICLLNVNNYRGLAAGAMLFSDDKLFGVGAFALYRGKRSVLIFTDVRPYHTLLPRTCTETDQSLRKHNDDM